MKSTVLNFVDEAVAERFLAIRSKFRERPGDYVYNGPRTAPDQLGWRFRQNMSLAMHDPRGLAWPCYPQLPDEIARGQHDRMIEHTWHDAASAEHYYLYEKDYGCFDEPEYPNEDDLTEKETGDEA